jgi:hypothetical protein
VEEEPIIVSAAIGRSAGRRWSLSVSTASFLFDSYTFGSSVPTLAGTRLLDIIRERFSENGRFDKI